jgi:peptide/nickel transport system permease protein
MAVSEPLSSRAGGLRLAPPVQSRTLSAQAWRRFRRHRLAIVGGVVLVAIVGVCQIIPLFVPESAANQVDPRLFRAPPTFAHPFGNDDVGRDIMWRTIYGGRISLAIGALSVTLAMTTGVVLGSVSGYYGGWPDSLIMRLTDAMLSMPSLLLLIVMTRILGPSVPTIILVIGFLNWMQVTRIVRANFLSLKQQDFVLAARALGVSDGAIIFRHVLPNTLAPVVIAATLGVGYAIILEASASFLGLGVQPPTASWGSMLYRAQALMEQAPWVAIFPGMMILITVMAINFIGEGLRDALDPRASVV